MSENTLLILDTNNFAFQAFGRTLLKYKGVRTELISIGLTMVRRYLVRFRPKELRFVYDGGRDVRRTSIYPEYKRRTHSERTLEELKERHIFFKQMALFKANMHRMGFTQVRCPGREADDVIYSVIVLELGRGNFDKVIVVSSDRDMFQLFMHFGNKVAVYNPIKNFLYDIDGAEVEVGVSMEEYVTYRAMTGDGSDNLPGVKGLGPKKAARLIELLSGVEEKSAADEKLLQFLSDNVDVFELMSTLIDFMIVEPAELAAGTSHSVLSAETSLENLKKTCLRYGLQRMLDSVISESNTFLQYWQGV